MMPSAMFPVGATRWDAEDVLLRLENRLGRVHARLRLGLEREHEAQAFGQGLTFPHLENMPVV